MVGDAGSYHIAADEIKKDPALFSAFSAFSAVH
jgi:hypothetical protein